MSFAMISVKPRTPALLLLAALAACSKPEQTATPAAGAGEATETEAPASATEAATQTSQAGIQAMSSEQLREAAAKALGENRIYAPGGDNAVEYYLAIREKKPADATVVSALTDLQPYLVIAAEQSIGREDFVESQRLAELIEKVDAKAPALPRLKQSIASAQAAVGKRSEAEAARVQELAKQQEEQRKAQQEEQQRKAAEALAAQQEEARVKEAAEQAAAERREREAAAAAARAAAPPPAPEPAPAPKPTAPALRLVSSPPPRYPPEALRAGTAGEVLVEFTVNTDGSVGNARVVRSNPARVFDREAVSAVRRWKFAPINTPTTTRRTINFTPSG